MVIHFHSGLQKNPLQYPNKTKAMVIGNSHTSF
jgi:hypothetical protein